MWSLVVLVLFQVFLFLLSPCHGRREEPNYYGIYEAIETMTSLTPHRTFYELLGVSPEASSDEISRAYRRLAVQYHPDKLRVQGKWNERMERLSNLVQFAGNQLRDEQSKRDYDWVLNEAPAWHRQTVYVMRRLVPSSKLTVKQVLLITVAFGVGLQLVAQWIGYAVAWYMILSSRWALKRMGDKEVKRLRKRMVGVEPSFMAMNNSAYHTILLADSAPPSLPSPLRLWIIQAPLSLLQSLARLIPSKAKTS